MQPTVVAGPAVERAARRWRWSSGRLPEPERAAYAQSSRGEELSPCDALVVKLDEAAMRGRPKAQLVLTPDEREQLTG